jgi:YebC/PmpR family DNA-binding regulatory protein
LLNEDDQEKSMSGHSKWHSIKHKKGALDAKRGKLFTKIIREMSIAARIGGGDPGSNPRLRTAVDKAKAVNMPADNIKRAIQKGTGELEGASYEEITLEGYGPGGVALLVEGTTDNRNRTVSEIRHVFSKNGGNLGAAGSVSYMFKPRGFVALAKEKVTEDKLMELALDAGADDIQDSGEIWEVYTPPNSHDAVVQALKAAGIEPDEATIGKYADNNVTLEGPKAQSMLKLVEALEDNDDVQNVWANFDVSEKDLEAAAS